MTTSPITLENIKFHLVWNKDSSFEQVSQRTDQPVSLEALIEYLIESLEDADKATAAKAENLLTSIGKPAVPFLVQGLKANHNRVKSVCAMVLVRIGQPAIDSIEEFYLRNLNRPKVRWIAEFILDELGSQRPALEKAQSATEGKMEGRVLPFAKTAVAAV
jgi:HEAT repeat protein